MTDMAAPQTYLNLIDGRLVEGRGWLENRNPADTRDLIGRFARGTTSDVDAAAAAASRAWPAWAATPAPARRRDPGRTL